MSQHRLVYRVHAVERMFERRITGADVEEVLLSGEVIAVYPDDTPYPSRLMLGFVRGRPLHVAFADNTAAAERIIITVYEPDPRQWDSAFRRRT